MALLIKAINHFDGSNLVKCEERVRKKKAQAFGDESTDVATFFSMHSIVVNLS